MTAPFVKDGRAFWVDPDGLDTGMPDVRSEIVVQASDKQVTLARTGPGGGKVYQVVGDGVARQESHAHFVYSTAWAAITAYYEHSRRAIIAAEHALVHARRRLTWVCNQILAGQSEGDLADRVREETWDVCRACEGDGIHATLPDTPHNERVTRDSARCTYCNGRGRVRPEASK